MNPVSGQSADFNTLARLIAASRINKLQKQVAQTPIAQAAQGYMADVQPENPNQAFQAGQAAAYSPSPLALPHEAAGGLHALLGLATGISKFNPRRDAMMADDVKDMLPVIQRYMTNKENPNYFVNDLPKDESVMRQVAGSYIDNRFATKSPLDNVAQELLNRINVDRSQPSSMLDAFNEAKDYVNNQPKKVQSRKFESSTTNVPWPRKK